MAFLFFTPPSKQSGFTLIELIIVVAIIGLLSVVVGFSLREMINRGKIARAQGDLNMIAKSIRQLELDTSLHPGFSTPEPCVASALPKLRRFAIDDLGTGLLSNTGIYNNWKGPYIEEIPKDPWNNSYYFRTDYECHSNTKGCEQVADGTYARAIFSGGENKSQVGESDDDDIVLILCHN